MTLESKDAEGNPLETTVTLAAADCNTSEGAAWHQSPGAGYGEIGPIPYWVLSTSEVVRSTIFSAVLLPLVFWER